MLFAIIDIETTGGNPIKDKITEIAIIIHDGQNIVNTYSTLINPNIRIPFEITQLTGISDEMVKNAPEFHEIAKDIIEMTENAVFVAHNVRFDYAFVRAAFKNLGYIYQRKTMCTVRLSRNVFKNQTSYSLGKLCESINIPIKSRHRAMGDAEATAVLFSKIFQELSVNDIDWIKKALGVSNLPPLLNEGVLDKIPEQITGVYYFYNANQEIIYIGKGKDIKKRIEQHLAIGSKGSRRALKMKTEIADISFESTGNELIALLLESDEIKKYKPIYNISQKKSRSIPFTSVYYKIDSEGFYTLYVDRYEENKEAIFTSDSAHKARELLYSLTEKYNLCLKKMDLFQFQGPCFYHQINKCKGACVGIESIESYNHRFEQMIKKHSFYHESFLLIGNGRHEFEKGVVWIEQGRYIGFGFIDCTYNDVGTEDLKACVKKYPHNRDIQQIIALHQKGYKKINLKNAQKKTETF